MNTKTSLLSFAALALFGTPLSADPNAFYVPMTSNSYDRGWIMFGVNAFSSGVPSSTKTTVQALFTTGYDEVTETDTTDDLAESGFQDSSGLKDMAAFQTIKDSDGNPYFTALTVAIRSNDLTFSQTEPLRSMYIALEGAPTIAKVKLDYKASLEGRELELQINNDLSKVYRTTISQVATFSAPAVATTQESNATVGTNMTRVDDLIAYNLNDSPIMPAAYDKDEHQGTPTGKMRFYHYNAQTQTWQVWDRSKTGTVANDFSDFEPGYAYWGRFDINNDDTAASGGTRSGLILGKSSHVEADYTVYTGKLFEGWNMLAFDPAAHPDIRNAATGLLIDATAAVNGDSVTIADETGNNTLSITLATTNSGATEQIAKQINIAIDKAKINGMLPLSFNIKAFAADTSDTNLIFLSDKKFTIKDGVGNSFGAATTLQGASPVITATGAIGAVADVATTGVTSRYGEFALIIEPMVGAGSASQLDSIVGGGGGALSALVQFGTLQGDSKNGASSPTPLGLAGNDTATTLTSAQTELSTDDIFTGVAASGRILQIDSDFDGATDMLLATSDTPFYVRDNTYTRVYTLNTTATGTAHLTPVAFKIINTVEGSVTPTTGDGTAQVAADINALADNGTASTDTKTYAATDGTKLVVVATNSRTFDIHDAESATIDYFKKSTSTADVARGAIKRVLGIGDLARETIIPNRWELKFTAEANGIDGGIGNNAFSVNGFAAADTPIANPTSTDARRLVLLDGLVGAINTTMKANTIAGFASHNYTDGTNDLTKAIITIEGIDLHTVTFSEDDGTLAGTLADSATNPGTLNLDGAAIVSDLKDNSVYTPDYANYGPLYTLKDAGFAAKVMLRPSTKLATPEASTHWDGIDLTRSSDEWLLNNEYNLFSVDNASGYWVYLEPYTDPKTITVSNVIYNPTYAYHFNADDTTENVIIGGEFNAQIAGIEEATSNAKIMVAGSEVHLTKEGTVYAARLTEYESQGLTPDTGSAINIALRAADGIGEAFYNASIATIDYDKPEKPSATFANGIEATFTSASTDVASYYIYEDFIPDSGASPITAALPKANATAYNMCHDFNFGTSHALKLIAVDGNGTLSRGNASNALSFNYVNILRSATVLTHTYEQNTSSITIYDDTCNVSTSTQRNGVHVEAQIQDQSVRMAYANIPETTLNNTTDLPWTSFYDLSGSGTAIIRVDSMPAYAGNRFFVEYRGALYVSTFPSTRDAADTSIYTPLILTPVNSANQTLVAPR